MHRHMCICLLLVNLMPHPHRRALGVTSAPRKHVVSGIVSSKPVPHRAFVRTRSSRCLVRYCVVQWGQGDAVVVDAAGARRASGAWLASRSQPAAPPVADFLTVAAMPGLSAAARAELHDWIQVEPHLLACLGQLSMWMHRLPDVAGHQVMKDALLFALSASS